MGEQTAMIQETCRKILTDHCDKGVVDRAEQGEWPAQLWDTLVDTGLTLAGIDESSGGSGGDVADGLTVVRSGAAFAAPIPLAETFMAARLIQLSDGQVPNGPLTVASGEFELEGGRLRGRSSAVAFARCCRHIVVSARSDSGTVLCVVPMAGVSINEATNIAGEPRDEVVMDCHADQVLNSGPDIGEEFKKLGALTRVVMMTGALESVLELSVGYALERNQFGRAIAKFQAIQQQLALLAGEVAAAIRATEAVTLDAPSILDIAVAKARVGEAVAACSDIAHQVHGAMGYTREHQLNHRTRRLWCWRDEYGNERFWQRYLGGHFIASGADRLWAELAEMS